MAAQTRAYDDDHYPLSITLPGRGTTTLARKTDGRLTGVGEAVFGYADATTRITSATRGAKADAFALRRRAQDRRGRVRVRLRGGHASWTSIQLAGAEQARA